MCDLRIIFQTFWVTVIWMTRPVRKVLGGFIAIMICCTCKPKTLTHTHIHTRSSEVNNFPDSLATNLCINQWINSNCLINEFIETARSAVSKNRATRNFENVSLVLCRKTAFLRFFGGSLGCWTLSNKQVFQYIIIQLLLVKWCRHSAESRAMTCPLKQCYLIAWSLLSWHFKHFDK